MFAVTATMVALRMACAATDAQSPGYEALQGSELKMNG